MLFGVQAEKFRSKAQKSDTWRVPAQYCRYLFYLGTIRAIQLEYSEAKEVLQQVRGYATNAACAEYTSVLGNACVHVVSVRSQVVVQVGWQAARQLLHP